MYEEFENHCSSSKSDLILCLQAWLKLTRTIVLQHFLGTGVYTVENADATKNAGRKSFD